MPELPEVETVRRGLVPVMEGCVVRCVDVRRRDLRIPVCDGFEHAIGGRKILRLIRRGKYLIGQNDSGHAFVWHLGMSGSVKIFGPDEAYGCAKHDHVIFTMSGGERIAFNDPRRFGMMYLVDAENWESERPFCDMGPEPLGNGFNGSVLRENLRSRKGPIKNALLDQKVVAGVGNIYACEALYRAKIHPLRKANDVNEDEAGVLAHSIVEVLNDAIQSGGSSLRDHKLTDGSMGYFQHSFDVYDREGEVCRRCCEKKSIEICTYRIIQAGRSSFYCSNTQR